jgi:hypothetical protein
MAELRHLDMNDLSNRWLPSKSDGDAHCRVPPRSYTRLDHPFRRISRVERAVVLPDGREPFFWANVSEEAPRQEPHLNRIRVCPQMLDRSSFECLVSIRAFPVRDVVQIDSSQIGHIATRKFMFHLCEIIVALPRLARGRAPRARHTQPERACVGRNWRTCILNGISAPG